MPAGPTLPDEFYDGVPRERLTASVARALRAVRIGSLALVVAGPGRVVRRQLERMSGAGSTIWLDRLTFGRRNSPGHRPSPSEAADLTPNGEVPTRVSRDLTTETFPEPRYPFAWRRPPRSGNAINGLGETDRRRADKVFHTVDYRTPWGGLEFYFHLSYRFWTFRHVLFARWDNRHQDGPVHPVSAPIDDRDALSTAVKQAALTSGAVAVGITDLAAHHVYADETVDHPRAISIAVTMDRELMRTVPSEQAGEEILAAYVDVGRVAIDLARRIRAMGWHAYAATNLDGDSSPVLHVPIAIDAGLGQLGKHGSLITRDHGSNVRLATVLTDLPLTADEPVDLAVDDFCASCQVCTTNCPPHAIFDIKQMVRGEERWYVDFDRCVPYFSEHQGCGICIEVCPWSEPGRGPVISQRMLGRRPASDHQTNPNPPSTAK